jgi:molybdopterin molybdotransferase
VKSIHEAVEEMLASFAPLPAQPVPLAQALGRVLARDVVAAFDLPEFDNSAMDGYALRAADVSVVGCALPLHGQSRAGGPAAQALPAGHAMRIFTGAPLPAGSDSVVMQEDTAAAPDGSVVIRALPRPGAHVRRQGSDLRRGTLALRAGTVLGPGELGLLASQDLAAVDVHPAPRVAILCTGDELREIGEPARPGSLINSNAYALAAAVQQSGGDPWVLPCARDEMSDVVARVRQGLLADVLLTVGGVSVGEYDLVGRALRDAGAQLAFHKVAIKPGKPLLFATAGRVPIVGLPGNPVSALVTFEVFVRPGLRRMQGHVALFPQAVRAQLDRAYAHKPGRTELARARLVQEGERLVAQLHALQGSGSLPSMAGVDALVILPSEQQQFDAGCDVWVLRLGDGPHTSTSPWPAGRLR